MSNGTHEPVGSVAEEAARLFAALQERLGAHDDVRPAECRVCPLCQLLSAVRTVRPEAVEHVVGAAGSLATALRTVFDGASQPSGEGHRSERDERSAGDGPAGGPAPADPPVVEHIEVR